MFRFVKNAPSSLLDALQAYIDAPKWDHALDVVPFLAMLERLHLPGAWSNTKLEADQFDHLQRSLGHWSAFRSGGDYQTQKENLKRDLPKFLSAVRDAIPKGCGSLAELEEDEARRYASRLETAMESLESVKGSRSPVLPSKTGHLLFPAWVPAYDQALISSRVMEMLDRPRRHRRWYHTYVLLCWWVLKECRAPELRDVRVQTYRLLRSDVALNAMVPRLPSRQDPNDGRLDTIAAEYLLIGMLQLKPNPVIMRLRSCCP